MEILSDLKTPIEVLKILQNVSGHCYLLESISDHENGAVIPFWVMNPPWRLPVRTGI